MTLEQAVSAVNRWANYPGSGSLNDSDNPLPMRAILALAEHAKATIARDTAQEGDCSHE